MAQFMPTSPSLPRTLAAWIKALDAVRLPIAPEEHQRARQALTDEHRSLREIADLLESSPVVVLQLMREANRSSHALGDPAETLEVALTRIGLKRASEVLSRVPLLEPGAGCPAFHQVVLISQHASQQASGLFSARLARLWQEIHWSSLLFLAPVWTLIGAHPELLEAWEQRVLVKSEPVRRVERDLLGLPLVELCLGLARHWQLPAWVIEGYRVLTEDRRRLVKALHIVRDNEHPLQQQQVLDDDPDLRRWLTLPSNTPLLANGLAISAHHTWSGLHTLRWECLTALYLNQPLGALQQLIHQLAVRSAERHALAGLWHPALSLVMPWESRYPPPRQAPAAAPASAQTVSLWRKYCAELLQSPSAFINALQLTACARDAYLAGGIARVLLLQLDPARNLLVTRQSSGLGAAAATLQLDPAHSQLLRQLMEKPRQLQLTPENFARFSAFLPGAIKSLFASENLLLRSLASNGRTVMLVIADQQGAPWTETALQVFSKTGQCLERALDNYAQRRR